MVTWIDNGGAWRCPCLLATARNDYEQSNAGGVYETNSFSSSATWFPLANVFPATGTATCPANPGAYDMAVSPDPPHAVYIATDCGIAVITPGSLTATPTISHIPVTGAPDQGVRSLLALPGGGLIAAGPTMGVWASPDGGTTWIQSVGISGTPFYVHAFALDPRGPGSQGPRAYALTEDASSTQLLSETLDGGKSWHPIHINLSASDGPCGGIPNIHAEQESGALVLYAGDICHIYRSSPVPLSQEPYVTLGVGSWSRLAEAHSDTRDLAFHSGTNQPYLQTSDGGIADSVNGGASFVPIGGPAHGLDANEVTEVTGQVPLTSAQPDLYFATWHNDLWAMHGTGASPAGNRGAEGFDLGLPPVAMRGAENKVTYMACWTCSNYLGSPGFPASVIDPGWRDAQTAAGNPIFLSPREYLEGLSPSASGGDGIALTLDDGAHWHRIASFSVAPYGWPHPAGRPSQVTVFLPYVLAHASGFDVVHLATVSDLSNTAPTSRGPCAPSTPNCLSYAAMAGFGSIGLTPTDTATYPVYAVDPINPNRIIAPDVANNDVAMSTDRGGSWHSIPGLTALVTHHNAYHFATPLWTSARSPLVSTVSFCPENDNRVLIGTREGGAYFSFDGGSAWTAVTNSAQIRYATSVYWGPGCASAYVSTWGRGIFQVNMQVHFDVVNPQNQGPPCAPAVCQLEQRLRRIIRNPHPYPSAARGVIVTDGRILKVSRGRKGPVIRVSAGSVVTAFKALPAHLKVIRVAVRPGSVKGIRAVVFLKHKVLRILRGSPAHLGSLSRGHVGKQLSAPPASPVAQITIPGFRTMFGSYAIVPVGKQFDVSVALGAPSTDTIVAQIDGRGVMKFAPGQKGLNFTLPASEALGTHAIQIVAQTANGPNVLATTLVAIVNGDTD